MYENTEKFVDLDFEQRVRQTAYHLWENDGRPDGREKEYWFQALEQLLAGRPQLASAESEKRIPSSITTADSHDDPGSA
ncbi:MAG: DUF2934 domain-containing protein [Devosia sp.]|uniref:DUF2934 domain-containing protein n=1 Tax=Devosia sp. TaxID=1871048 RepID=UPI00339972C3